MLKRFVGNLASPGTKGAIQDAAPTQIVCPLVTGEKAQGVVLVSPNEGGNITGYIEHVKDNRLDRWLDRIVRASGSQPVFLLIIGGLVAWALAGIRYGDSENWAALISDIQAIVSYGFDSLLMRQQLNRYERQIHVSAQLRSRMASQKRMLRQIHASGRYMHVSLARVVRPLQSQFGGKLPAESWTSRVSSSSAALLGHFGTICAYWCCIAIWLGFGPYCRWSDRWQLYINSSTSALMVLIFTFLANIHERHGDYVEECLNAMFEIESEVELKLRILTGDTVQNPTVVVPAPKLGRAQRAIFYYADVVGTLVGIVLLFVVMVVWLCIGPAMLWDSNWWLLIGTYAGLVGLIDGFVLRNVQASLHDYEVLAFDQVKLEDTAIFDEIGLPQPEQVRVKQNALNFRLSNAMGTVCAHELTVLAGIMLVVGLIVGASAMRWTTTGQLICNIPPSIIESFFMMILITGHNLSEAQWRADLHNMFLRRLRLLAYVDRLEEGEEDESPTKTPNSNKLIDARHPIPISSV